MYPQAGLAQTFEQCRDDVSGQDGATGEVEGAGLEYTRITRSGLADMRGQLSVNLLASAATSTPVGIALQTVWFGWP